MSNFFRITYYINKSQEWDFNISKAPYNLVTDLIEQPDGTKVEYISARDKSDVWNLAYDTCREMN